MIIREARPEDSSAICRISSRELGYPCTEALVKRQMEAVDRKREAVFVAEINASAALSMQSGTARCIWNPWSISWGWRSPRNIKGREQAGPSSPRRSAGGRTWDSGGSGSIPG